MPVEKGRIIAVLSRLSKTDRRADRICVTNARRDADTAETETAAREAAVGLDL
jgi:hypothetical protein